jgi:hypothetical protein
MHYNRCHLFFIDSFIEKGQGSHHIHSLFIPEGSIFTRRQAVTKLDENRDMYCFTYGVYICYGFMPRRAQNLYFITIRLSTVENRDALGANIARLLNDAEARLQEMALMPPETGPDPTVGVGGGSGGSEKQRLIWERRVRSLKKMLLGFDQARTYNIIYITYCKHIAT